ncbi:hypothetical protein FQR65_LT05378 [Abscondita terminalis]|nr:hypothetical protein FQR65_LT05378 [Abscondita terminalis]
MNYFTLAFVVIFAAAVVFGVPVDETNLKEPPALSELNHVNTKATSMTDSHIMSIGKSGSEKSAEIEAPPNALKPYPMKTSVENDVTSPAASSTILIH